MEAKVKPGISPSPGLQVDSQDKIAVRASTRAKLRGPRQAQAQAGTGRRVQDRGLS